MKKIICLLLMLVLCLGMLAACGKDDGNGDGNTDDGDTPVKTTAEEAKDLLFAMYKDDPSTTQADYELVGVIKVGDATCNIVWSVNVTSGVTVGAVNEKKMVPVDVDEEAAAEIAYVLTATITDPDGNTATVTLNRVVPKFKVNTFEDYIAAKTDDPLVIEGIVVGINSKDAGNKRNHLFIADLEGKGGYYIYDMPKDPVKDYGVEVGMTVRVSGIAAPYGDMQEMKQGAVKILDSNKKDLTAIDISAEFDKTEFDISKYVGALVNVKGVTIGAQELDVETSQYLFFTKGAIKSYVRTYVTDLPTSVTAEDKATIDAFHASKFGYNADVTGILIMYNKDYYLLPIGTEPFTNVTLPERTDAEKIELEVGNVTVTDNVTTDSVINLPLTGSTYDSVVFTWALSENDCATLVNGVLTVTLPDEATTITLTLTATCGEATAVTKAFTVKVDAAVSDLYLPVKVETPKKDTAYKFFLAQNTLGANYYFEGKMSGNYLSTTTNSAKAVDVYLEEVDGGYLLYFMDGETKKYIEIYEYQEGRVGVQITATKPTTNKYTFNTKLGILVSNVAGDDYYLGTYDKITNGAVEKSYNTMSASKLSYISGENASKIGVSQFPSYLATFTTADYDTVKVETPKKDTAYKFFLAQNTLGANYYFEGKMSGNYLATTTNSAKAVDVYLEEVDGGYLLYFMDGETKKYIEIYEYQEGRVGVQITATKPTTNKYTFNTKLGILVSKVAGDDYYLGTYDKITNGAVEKSYNTMSASKLSYISGENASKIGVSQFPSYLATLELKETAPVKVETPKKDTAYKFFLAQNTLGANYYFAGKMSGNYLATTTKLSKAVDVYLEEVDGGYLLYFMDGETKKYIEIYEYQEGRVGVQITDTKPTANKYTFNTELGILVSNVAGDDYYLGTYDKITNGAVEKSYNTMSASKLSYISDNNASKIGVSQFPSYLATIEFVDGGDAPVIPEDPEDPEDPDQPGQGGEGGEGGEGGDTGDTGDTPNVPVVPGEPTEDVVKTYVDNTTYSGVSLIVTVNETKKTVYFLYTQPTKTSEATYNYTIAEDGSVTLTNDDGTEVLALMAAITFEDGVATEATWNGNNFYLEVAPQPEVVAVYTGTAENGTVFIVTMNETAGTVTFTFTHPMTSMPVNSEYAYTVVDGAIVLTLLGETVAAEEAFVTLTDGVPTAAGYWGQEFALVPYTEPEEEVITVYESEDGVLTVTVNETAGTVTYDFVPPMGAPSSATFNYEIVDGAVVLTNDDGSAVNPLQATLTIVDGVATSAGYNGFDYALTVGGSDEPVIEGTPILVGDTTVNVTEDDITYGAIEYVLTVTEAGTYTFTTDFLVQIRDNFGVAGVGSAYLEEGVYNVIIVVEGATAGEYTVNLTYTAPEGGDDEEEEISLWDGCEIDVTADMITAGGFTAIFDCWTAGEYDVNSSTLVIKSITASDGTVIEKNANGYYEFVEGETYTVEFGTESVTEPGVNTISIEYQYPAGHQENPIEYTGTENIKVTIGAGENLSYEMIWYYFVATKTGMLTLTDISARTDVYLSVTAVKGSDVTNVTYDADGNPILSKAVSMPVKEGTVCYIGIGSYDAYSLTEDAAYEVTVSIDGEYVSDGTLNAPHDAVVGENTVTVPVYSEVIYVYNATANGTLTLSSDVTGVYWFASTDIEAYAGVLSLEVEEGDKVYIRISYDHDGENNVEFAFNVAFEKEETAEDIVNAAYELAEGASLPEKKTLTGVIVSVDEAYNTKYSNVTVTIIVGDMYDKPIQCYRIKGTGADTIKVGDTITVSGTIKNYYGTIEFDAGSTLDAVDTTTTLNDNHKLYLESKNVEIKNAVTADGDIITLPAAGTTYTDVTVSWVSDNACAVIADGKVTFTLQAEAQTVKLTATYTVGETTKTVEYTVNVAAKPVSVTGNKLATFEFGENVDVTDDAEDHKDGSGISEGEVYTDGTYKLTLTGVSKVYDGGNDEMGNSALKLGTKNDVATFSFTVGEDVDFVIIKVAQYKANTTKVTVNGEEYTILTSSNNGEYTEIKVDTSVNKTVTFSTVSGACRAMVDSIAYWSKD